MGQAGLTEMHMFVDDAGDEVFARGVDDLGIRSLSLRSLICSDNLFNLALRNKNTCHEGLAFVDKCRIFDIVVH